ncbi:unnamed protein product [Caenorhabditis auriculariae]|uniref:Nudix hydrolase domain-containing protein n=1 Tax=Caenorhabditis auriculariae TaxID=2777116 RepID=A0A8S1HQE5_9PELO|nr:unnamed protein product [Caenorhabditis auriculariae]
MVLSDEEYIAESRDPTPEPTTEIIEQSMEPPQVPQGILKKRLEAIGEEGENGGLKGEVIKEERVPDMQLGKCRYVRLHDNVNYVGAALVLRGEGDSAEVLLIQEAKKSCRGKWYVPAGRVEAGETLEESVKREVLEETGYSCDVIELLSMQVQGSGWYRFAFFCRVTGGDLKTTPDNESLCAEWFPIADVKSHKMPLRGKDFIRLVDEAVEFRRNFNESMPRILPLNINMQGLFMEFMIVKYNRDETRTEVLVHKTVKDEEQLAVHDQPFPTVEFGFEYFFAMVVSKCYRHLLEEGANVVFAPSHVVRVKCHPRPMESLAHGLAVRVFCRHKQTSKAFIRSPRYHWITVENEETRRNLHMDSKQYRASLHML